MAGKRRFKSGGCQHLYQISYDRSLLFCTITDMLVMFTLICVKALQYNVRITEVCIMLNHFHIQAYFKDRKDMEEFMDSLTWTFAIIFNHHYGLKGNVFHKSYGNACKMTADSITGNLIYIANNPVGKKAVSSAWDYRWNFLRYSPFLSNETNKPEFSEYSRHPFSERFDPLEASKDMIFLVKAVKRMARAKQYLNYRFFESQKFRSLSEREKQQLADIIITEYNVIDYVPILQKYGSVQEYCKVLSMINGNEYEISDDKEKENYRHYMKMISISAEEGYDLRTKRYSGVEGETTKNNDCLMPRKLAEKLKRRFIAEAEASRIEIRKFLKTT